MNHAFGVSDDEISSIPEKYIRFGLESETYCIPILSVQEVISEYTLTSIPNLPSYYHGVISLRGEAILVVNLRKRFALPDKAPEKNTRVIILDLDEGPLGIEVDEVHRVVSLRASDIETAPKPKGGKDLHYLKGVAEIETSRFSMVLDVNAILTSAEKSIMREARESLAPGAMYSIAPEKNFDQTEADEE